MFPEIRGGEYNIVEGAMSDFVKHYTNGDVTIVWKADLCEHSARCFRGLPQVFDPRIRPWIRPENASSEDIIAIVRQCPSGALTILEAPQAEPAPPAAMVQALSIDVAPGGPYRVHVPVILRMPDGTTVERTATTALCRCGHSRNKPYCDGSHVSAEFDG